MNAIELKLFSSRLQAICDEMGGVLRRSAFSPNIKDRLDFSCALFAADGSLAAQAAHIPVHLGSMAYSMSALVSEREWLPGDVLVLNDPYRGGTHLPDVTLVAPVFLGSGDERAAALEVDQTLVGFVANRAHHANIGCASPGSMPLSASIEEEGVLIAPTLLRRGGRLLSCGGECDALLFTPAGTLNGDFAAQLGANDLAVGLLNSLIESYGLESYRLALASLNDYAQRLARTALSEVSAGVYSALDYLDDDGFGGNDLPLRVTIELNPEGVRFDFSATVDQVDGNLNCPESVAAAAAYYCFRCLLPEGAPLCAGLFADTEIVTRRGSILCPEYPAAVAAGNVETSMRLVDLLFRALSAALPERIPAASQGSMNNVALGSHAQGERWDYYETLAGGAGAGPDSDGRSAVHSHMTNTLNTPVESLEYHYPLRIRRYQIRSDSAGRGARVGGEGLVREYEFLSRAQVSLLTERRSHAPWGLAGGGEGGVGRNWLNGRALAAKSSFAVEPGDRLTLETPGGGGWGEDSLSKRSKSSKSSASAVQTAYMQV